MFNRLELALARRGIAQQLSSAQRKWIYRCACVAAVLFVSAYLSTVLAVLGALAYVVAGRVLPPVAAAPTAPSAPSHAPGVVPPLAQRPVPELSLAFNAYMRSWRDLLRGVPQDERAGATIALLEIMEDFTAGAQLVSISARDITRRAAAGQQPRLTKPAVDLFAKRATLVRDQVVDLPQGRFLAVRICFDGGPDIRVFWSVRMLGATCQYQIERTELV